MPGASTKPVKVGVVSSVVAPLLSQLLRPSLSRTSMISGVSGTGAITVSSNQAPESELSASGWLITGRKRCTPGGSAISGVKRHSPFSFT